MTTESHKPFSILGVGAAACVACCAGPMLGFLAATGLFTAAGTALFGATGLLVLVPAGDWYVRRRRRVASGAVSDDCSVPVTLGRRP